MAMSSPQTPAAFLATRRITRLLGAALALAVIGTLGVLTAIPAQADSAASARSARFTIHGAGWGHGWGMSQYGAYGAARKGLSWKRILAFYYRGTQLSTMPSGTKIKVWITADNDSSLRVLPASGLTVRDSTMATHCRRDRTTPRGESVGWALAIGSPTEPKAAAT